MSVEVKNTFYFIGKITGFKGVKKYAIGRDIRVGEVATDVLRATQSHCTNCAASQLCKPVSSIENKPRRVAQRIIYTVGAEADSGDCALT